MVVGMVTVFIVLIIIIQLSKLLITLVNKYAPAEEEGKKKSAPAAAAQTIAPDIMEAIRQAVTQITNGKGNVVEVTRL